MQRRGILGGRPRNIYQAVSSTRARRLRAEMARSPNMRLAWLARKEPSVCEHLLEHGLRILRALCWEPDNDSLAEQVGYRLTRLCVDQRLSEDWLLDYRELNQTTMRQVRSISLVADWLVFRVAWVDAGFAKWSRDLQGKLGEDYVDLDVRRLYRAGYALETALEVLNGGE